MNYCTECGGEAVVWYCGYKKVNPENYQRALRECKDLRYYCKRHLPRIITNEYAIFSDKKQQTLPKEYVRIIEKDLNKITRTLPDYLEKNFQKIQKNWEPSIAFDFLVGYCLGTCESSYFQGYQEKYGEVISEEQKNIIRKIIARRRIQIEQGVLSFLQKQFTNSWN